MKVPFKIAYLFTSYPTLSQTFLQREMDALARQGFLIEIHACRVSLKKNHSAVIPNVEVHPFRPWDLWRLAFTLPRELMRDPRLAIEAARLLRKERPRHGEHWGMSFLGVVFAFCRASHFRRSGVQLIHGAWATAPATAAAVLSRLCGIPFSFGAHAYDLYRKGGDPFLVSKARGASCIHTTTEENVHYLKKRIPREQDKIVLARRGLEALPVLNRSPRDSKRIRILSVARLVPKKGHEDQIAACLFLKEWKIDFELRIVGEGPLRSLLQRKIDDADLSGRIALRGAMTPERVQEQYGWADLFLHTGIIDPQGDRDGLPNVIPEALAHGLAVVSSRLPGAAEAVRHEETGWLVSPSQPRELAEAVRKLFHDPALRQKLGRNGRDWVAEHFLIEKNAAVLREAFRAVVGGSVRGS